MENYIVGIGEALWDLLPSGKQLGGAPANFAYHVKQLGLPAVVVSAVGKDSLGEEILHLLKEKHIPSVVSQSTHPTGVVEVSLDEAGIPSYEIKTGVAWDYIPFTEEVEELARHTRAVCFGSLAQRNDASRVTIYKFLEAMPHGENVLKVFDINLRQSFYSKEVLHESLLRCNILKINDEELDVVSKLFALPDVSPSERCRQLLETYQLKFVILTCGEQGSYVISSNQTSYLDTPKVKVVDTVGAGDAFTAAFISGIIHGKSLNCAHRMAVDVAAYICTQPGAMPEFVDRNTFFGE